VTEPGPRSEPGSLDCVLRNILGRPEADIRALRQAGVIR
jgi:hypothetical protein